METTLNKKSKADNPYFTLFTPVFNGEKHLSRVFDSISNQTLKNFEWIIIDDGSTDNTKNMINDFIEHNPDMDIHFISQKNSGKHIAWNKAVELARGSLFIPADADDYFCPDTLSFFKQHWESLTSEEQMDLSGINVLCFDNDSEKIIGQSYPKDGMKTNNLDLHYKLKIVGEKWGCVRTDLLKSRPFPIVKNTHFPESYLWLYFAKKYHVICYNHALRRYYTTSTGIIQTCLGKKNIDDARVLVQYNSWLLKNFGFYLMVNSPISVYQTLKCSISSMLVIFKGNISHMHLPHIYHN
jgi:glycosyltransferase involved in cell wall biosynthesis